MTEGMKYSTIALPFTIIILLLFLFSAFERFSDEYISEEEAREFPGYEFMGEYTGDVSFNGGDEYTASLQVAVYGENSFRGLFIAGQLPGVTDQAIGEDQMFEVQGELEGESLIIEGNHPLRFRYSDGQFEAINNENEIRGYLERVIRTSPAMGMSPPENAVILFDGTHLDYWNDETQMTEDGLLIQGATTAAEYGDMRLHAEAKLGFMPNSESSGRANSGIYIQNRYEVQIIDSFGLPPQISGNGSLYNESAPRINTSLPPLAWQTYDVFFRAPRFDEDGSKTENARITVYLNGILVQDDEELESGTGAGGQREEVTAAELYLQGHTGPVRFRNVWMVEGEANPPGTAILEY
jgi:hypothetical protein